jgi:phosphatidylethanolamine/phosphatidyl-N-methylethanolamine N-methyltransferase
MTAICILGASLRDAAWTDFATLRCARAYERVAPFYDLLDGPYEYLWKRRLRADVLGRTRGRILDAAVGTGKNMPFYPPGSQVVGIDISAAMLDRARQRAARLGVAVDLLKRDMAETGLPDASFDSIVAAFVFCCIPDERKPAALRELRRLVDGDGRIFLLDYTKPSAPAWRAYMRLMAPWLRFMFSARYDSGLELHFAPAGLRIEESREFMGGGVILHVLSPT